MNHESLVYQLQLLRDIMHPQPARTDVQLIRSIVAEEIARHNAPEQVDIFPPEAYSLFDDNPEALTKFLATQDAKDALCLFTSAFEAYLAPAVVDPVDGSDDDADVDQQHNAD